MWHYIHKKNTLDIKLEPFELLQKIKEKCENRTKEERFQFLIDAKILNKKGFFDKRFFSKETCEKSRTH